MEHSRIARVFRLLIVLGSGQPYTVDDLARLFSITRRTVFRDLRLLQNIGIPYSYDHKQQCYRIEPGFFMPCDNLSRQEALSLLLLVKTAANIDFPFKSLLQRALLKIHNSLPETTKRYCVNTLSNIFVTRSHRKSSLFDKFFVQIIDAIDKKRTLEILYLASHEQQPSNFLLDPYHIKYHENNWFIIGKSNTDKAIGTFNLKHIQQLNPTNTFFFHDDDFDINEYLGRTWSTKAQNRVYLVKLKFTPQTASEVTATKWHNTQTIVNQPDGSVIVEFRLDSLNEVKWWILSFGDQVQVIAPPSLREMILATAQKILKLNQQTDAPR